MTDHRPPLDDPPEGGGRQDLKEGLDMTVISLVAPQGAVGTSRFGRGQSPTSAKA